MTLPTSQTSGGAATDDGLIIPADIAAQFGPLIALIRGSESMNKEERQYWINILPAMTPEQRKNLEEILQSERAQLAAIDAKYAHSSVDTTVMEQKIKTQKEKRAQHEHAQEEEERERENDILQKISSL